MSAKDSDLELVEIGPLTDADRRQLEGDEVDPFDAAGQTLLFGGKDRHIVLRGPDGRLVASAGVTMSEAEVGGAGRFAVVGIGGVIVAASHRGRGLARRVVEAVLDRSWDTEAEFALLFCHADRQGLYERLGFALVPPPVRVRQPGGYTTMTQQTMWRGLRPGATWPRGETTIHSLPF